MFKLKEATTYLNDIGEYYRAKNYNVFMNSYSRSLSISSVAQYIKYECNKKTVYFLHRFAFYFLTKIEGSADREE